VRPLVLQKIANDRIDVLANNLVAREHSVNHEGDAV
jgi:hypothetical protein